jgi:hypothetical protein
MTQITTVDPNPPPSHVVIDFVNLDPTMITGGSALALSFVGGYLWKYVFQPRLKAFQNSFQRTVEMDERIVGRLYIMLDKYKASRVLIYQTHNGSVYVSGQHQWKVSITHEVTSSGTSSVKHWSQSEPYDNFLSNHPKLLDTFGSLLKLSDDSMDNLAKFKHRFLNHGIEGILTKVLKDEDQNKIIGFIEIHWNDPDNVPNWDTELQDLSLEINKVLALLLRKDENFFFEVISKLGF